MRWLMKTARLLRNRFRRLELAAADPSECSWLRASTMYLALFFGTLTFSWNIIKGP